MLPTFDVCKGEHRSPVYAHTLRYTNYWRYWYYSISTRRSLPTTYALITVRTQNIRHRPRTWVRRECQSNTRGFPKGEVRNRVAIPLKERFAFFLVCLGLMKLQERIAFLPRNCPNGTIPHRPLGALLVQTLDDFACSEVVWRAKGLAQGCGGRVIPRNTRVRINPLQRRERKNADDGRKAGRKRDSATSVLATGIRLQRIPYRPAQGPTRGFGARTAPLPPFLSVDSPQQPAAEHE